MKIRAWPWVIAGLVLGPVVFVVGGLTATQGGSPGALPVSAVAPVGAARTADDPAAVIDALEQRLDRLPLDDSSWAALGEAYIAQARRTADPSDYDLAAAAFSRSLEVRPDGNADALAGQAALANARHDFVSGRKLAEAATAADPYDATARGVLADALVELGEYDEARTALQEMADLRPGIPALTRISYLDELHGDDAGARVLLERALAMASSADDRTFALQYLGRLSLASGDHARALAEFEEGLSLDDSRADLLAGRAAARAALGDIDGALDDYATVVVLLPQPSYLVQYGELLDAAGRHDEAAGQYRAATANRARYDAADVVPDIEVALAEADHGDPAVALQVAEDNAAVRRSVEVSDALAWALHVNGRDVEALDRARDAQRIGTRSALFAYHRGMIELALGLDDDARASLTEALDTDPEFSPLHAPLARQALQGLGTL